MHEKNDPTLEGIKHVGKLAAEGKITTSEFVEAGTDILFNGQRKDVIRYVENHPKQFSTEKGRENAFSEIAKIVGQEDNFNFIQSRIDQLFGGEYTVKRFSKIRQAILDNASPDTLTKEGEQAANQWIEHYFKLHRTDIKSKGFIISKQENGLVDIIHKSDSSKSLSFPLGNKNTILEPYLALAEQEANNLDYRSFPWRAVGKIGTIATIGALAIYIAYQFIEYSDNKTYKPPASSIRIVEQPYDDTKMQELTAALAKQEQENKERDVLLNKSTEEQAELKFKLEDVLKKQELTKKERDKLEEKVREMGKRAKKEKEDITDKFESALKEQGSALERLAQERQSLKINFQKYEITGGEIGQLTANSIYNPDSKADIEDIFKDLYERIDDKLADLHEKSLKDYVKSKWIQTGKGLSEVNSVKDYIDLARASLKSNSDTASFESMDYLRKAKKALDKIKDKKHREEVDKVTGLTIFIKGDNINDIDGYDTAENIGKYMARSIQTEILGLFAEGYNPTKEYNSFISFSGKKGVKFEKEAFNKKHKESITNWNSFNRSVIEPYSLAYGQLYLVIEGFENNRDILKKGLDTVSFEHLEGFYQEAINVSLLAGLKLNSCYEGDVSGIGRPGEFKPKPVKDWGDKVLKEIRMK